MKHLNTLKSAMLSIFTVLVFSGCTSNTITTDISANDLVKQLGDDKILILDVRSHQEYVSGHIPGAINIPHTSISSKILTKNLQQYKDETVVLYCKSGHRANIAAETLANAGFSQLRHLDGDMDGWRAGNHPIEQ